MAGGEGTRLRPLTVSRPKPMVPVCNRPVMEYTLDLLKRHGIETVVVTLHYKAEDIVSYFGDGTEFGHKIIYSVESIPLGTAGSVKEVQEYIGSETFMVISGDGLTDIDLSRAIAFHKEKKAVATLVLMRVNNPLEYGVVITDESGAIQCFLEKPTWGEVFSDQVNTGIYILEPEIFDLMEKNKEYDFSRDIFPHLLKEKKGLYGYVASGYWCDIGDIDHYAAAHRDMFNGKVLQEMVGAQRAPGVWIGEGTKIDPTATLEAPLMIGRNCRIGAHSYVSSYTCIGDNCIIEEDVSLHRDIIFNNVFFGRKSNSTGAIIGRQSTIKPGVTLCDSCVIGENVFIGRGATVRASVSIWPDKHIPDGSIISENLVWGKKNSETLFGRDGIVGLGNLEITPEFAMKLGAAFGTTLPKGSTVAVSRDTHPVCRLANRALISGLSSVGVNILDLRLLPAAVSRYIVNISQAVGGIHTRIYRDEARLIEIDFFDERGINIEKTRQRKLENYFVRQDFRRTDIDEVGIISYVEDSINRYIDGFTKCLQTKAIKGANFKIVVDYSYGGASQVLPFILNKLGVDTVSLNAYVDYDKAREAQEKKEGALRQLSEIVKPVGANLGIIIEPDAERFYLVDEEGQAIKGTNLLALMALMVFRSRREALVAVPISVPGIMEKLAQQEKGKIIRTKTDHRSIMHSAAVSGGRIALAGTASGAFVFPEFSPSFDAMFALAKLLEMLSAADKPLSEIVKAVPPHYSLSGRVDCNWSDKAKVMRLLVERFRDEKLELLDGVRVDFADESSVLMVPHPSLARINVWTDASTKERARQLMERARYVIPRLAAADESQIVMERKKGACSEPISSTTTIPEDRAFHFWIPGRYLGIQVRSLRTFIDVLHYVEAASLEYHMERNDFANWLRTELCRPLLANDLEALSKSHYKGEELRRHLLACLGESCAEIILAGEDGEEEEELEEVSSVPPKAEEGGIKLGIPSTQEDTPRNPSLDSRPAPQLPEVLEPKNRD